jgi:hypothetical protein
MLLLLTQMVLQWEIHVLRQLNWIDLFGTKRAHLHLENPMFLEVILWELTWLSEGINILDVPASDTNGFLLRNECVSSTQLKRPIWTNIASLHHENPKLQEVFIKKNSSVLRGKQCSRYSHLTQMGFFGEIHVLPYFSWIGLLGTKRAQLHLEKPKLEEVFVSKSNSILIGKHSVRCSCF